MGLGLWLLLGLLGLAALWAHATHPAGQFTRGGQPHGDGTYHYAQVRSLVLDGDLRLANDYTLVGNPHRQPVREDGWAGSHFTVGTAITWIPSFVVAHAVTRGGDALGWWDDPGDGSSARCQRITMLGSVASGWLALVLIAMTLRRWYGRRTVGVVVVLVAASTPLWWYMTRQPSWSHAASALAVAGLVHACVRGDVARGARYGAAVGLWLGLVVLVRPQDVVFAVVPLASVLGAMRRSDTRAPAMRAAAALTVGAATCWLPQAWVWHQTYGSAWVISQGAGFMRWSHSQWDLVLWSSRGGLLPWSPLCAVAILGTAYSAIKGPTRALARALGVSLLAAVYVCGAAEDWWGGWAFGARRLVSASVVFALGWAALLEPVLARKRGGVVVRLLVVVAVLGGVRLSSQLRRDYLMGTLERGVPQAMSPVWSRAFGLPLEPAFGAVGTPGSWPASWVFAWRTGAPAGRYDETMGWALVHERRGEGGRSRLWVQHPRWAVHGWGPADLTRTHPPRAVEGEAVLAIPLREPLSVALRMRAWSARGATVHASTSTGEHFELQLRPGWHDVDVPLQRPLGAGLNLLRLRPLSGARVEVLWVDVFDR
ncbi:MAG: hypothetical protein K0V04_21235 [Deltaproteobacteria bacterium]|nr:hypothetical protein [Deltaproteobacteria bacterium]